MAYAIRCKPKASPFAPFKTGADYKKLVTFSAFQERLIW